LSHAHRVEGLESEDARTGRRLWACRSQGQAARWLPAQQFLHPLREGRGILQPVLANGDLLPVPQPLEHLRIPQDPHVLTGLVLTLVRAAFLAHERNVWLYGRSSFVHHVCGWTLIAGAVLALAQIVEPRSLPVRTAFALTFVVLATALFSTRDTAPIFGHISPGAGTPHR
jgi:hypothetical protein